MRQNYLIRSPYQRLTYFDEEERVNPLLFSLRALIETD